jgi:hypothetical protein
MNGEQGQPPSSAVFTKPSRPVWAAVIGVLSIVLASFELAQFVQAVIIWSSAGVSWRIGSAWQVATHETGVISCVVVGFWLSAGLLLAAGISLLRRAPAARLHLPYAVLRLIVIAVMTVTILYHFQDGLSSMKRLASLPNAPCRIPGPVAIWLAVLFGALVTAAYPVFLLIWFARPIVRRRVAAWARRGDSDPPDAKERGTDKPEESG